MIFMLPMYTERIKYFRFLVFGIVEYFSEYFLADS